MAGSKERAVIAANVDKDGQMAMLVLGWIDLGGELWQRSTPVYYPTTNGWVGEINSSDRLTNAVNCILQIYNMLVIGMDSMESVVKCQQWREADSVRSIANRTDNVPHLLIGVDMFIHWMDNIGAKGVPFPDWYNCLFPSLNAISGHPWLLIVERWYDATHQGLVVQQETSTAKPVLIARPTIPDFTASTSDMGASNAVSVDKGKGKVVPGEPEAMCREVASRCDVNNDGESEVGEMELEVDEDISEPAGKMWKVRMKGGQASQSGTATSSSSAPPERLTLVIHPPAQGTSTYAVPPTI
ncbi:hypothetical protein EDC04DRAFT_2605633 [Pisolithus marmoratus]|nr:hypothetical protein EDC04DRAFT_2605633 [Pisolithus marmoratus]